VRFAMALCRYLGINLWLSSGVVIRLRRRLHVSFYFLFYFCIFAFCLYSVVDLTKYGSHVYVLVRRHELRASKIMQKRLLNNPKVVRTFPPLLNLFFAHSYGRITDNPLEHSSNQMLR
jgi:hypothetical protein